LCDDLTPLRSLLEQLTRSPPEEQAAVAEAILERLEPDIHQWWTLAHEKIRSEDCPTYTDFGDEFFTTLFASLRQLRNLAGFPKLFMDTLAEVMHEMLDRAGVGDGRSVAAPQQLPGVPRLQGIFISRMMVCWYADRLPARMREALVLRFVNGLNIDEVAAKMGLTREGATTDVRNGIAHIRQYALEDAARLARGQGAGPGNAQ
jgi:hypothetical protein